MQNAMSTPTNESGPRSSSDSRRPSFSFSRRPSRERDSIVHSRRTSRRFSWLPASFSIANFGGRRDADYDAGEDSYTPGQEPQHQPPMTQQSHMGRPQSNTMAINQGADTPGGESTNAMQYDPERERAREQRRQQARHDKALPPSPGGDTRQRTNYSSSQVQRKQFRDDGYGGNVLDYNHQQEPVERFFTPSQEPEMAGPSSRPEQYNLGGSGEWEHYEPNARQQGLRPQQKKFGYDARGPSSSSNPAKRVMGYFRNKGRARDGEAS